MSSCLLDTSLGQKIEWQRTEQLRENKDSYLNKSQSKWFNHSWIDKNSLRKIIWDKMDEQTALEQQLQKYKLTSYTLKFFIGWMDYAVKLYFQNPYYYIS